MVYDGETDTFMKKPTGSYSFMTQNGPWSGHELKFQSINVFPNSRIFLSFGDVYLKKSPNVSLAKELQTAYFHKIVLHVNVLFKCLVNTP